jgi:hypothetical protein
MSHERRSVLDAMSESGEYTPKDLAMMLGKPVNGIKQLLLHLFNDRFVEKAGYGKYVKVLGRQTYGLTGSVTNADHAANAANADNADNSHVKDSIQELSALSGPIEGGNSYTAHPNASNGKSYQRDHHSIETSAVGHDRKREQEVMSAVGRQDYRAARRAAGQIRGRKDSDRVNQLIDDAEQEFRRRRDENGGYVSPEGY